MNSKVTLVRDVMTHEVATLERNDRLSTADNVMRLGRIRHMPVLEDGNLVGLVTQRDLFRGALLKALGYGLKAQQTMLDTLAVKEVMATDLVTIAPNATLQEAAGIMVDWKIGCLPVVDNEKLVGILTEGDFVALVAGG